MKKEEAKSWTCKKNCGECCGVTPIPNNIFFSVDAKCFHNTMVDIINIKNDIMPITEDGLCVFLDRKTKDCSIYDKRPDVCRLYGRIPKLQCPYIKIDGTKRTVAETKKMHKENGKNILKKINKIKRSKI